MLLRIRSLGVDVTEDEFQDYINKVENNIKRKDGYLCHEMYRGVCDAMDNIGMSLPW